MELHEKVWEVSSFNHRNRSERKSDRQLDPAKAVAETFAVYIVRIDSSGPTLHKIMPNSTNMFLSFFQEMILDKKMKMLSVLQSQTKSSAPAAIKDAPVNVSIGSDGGNHNGVAIEKDKDSPSSEETVPDNNNVVVAKRRREERKETNKDKRRCTIEIRRQSGPAASSDKREVGFLS